VTIILPALDQLLRIRCGTMVVTIEHNAALMVHQRAGLIGWDPDTLTDQGCETVTLTEDGRSYRPGWHDPAEHGPEGEWIAVERWSARGREFHGFIDSRSRRLLQAG
jgi:hypothetical protein